MSIIQIPLSRPDPALIGRATIASSTSGVSDVSQLIASRLNDVMRLPPTYSAERKLPRITLEEQLYDALASFKIRTAAVAMHLDRDWRNRLFAQLDSLLALSDWEADDTPPSIASFSTFLRMLIFLRPERRPGLGATSDGHLIATWTVGEDRLTIECMPRDLVRWHLTATIEGERERAAADSPVQRLPTVLQPYNPKRWFDRANNVSS